MPEFKVVSPYTPSGDQPEAIDALARGLELGLDEQAMLLRAIEEKTFLPLGADKEVGSSFQLVCGTNRDLEEAVAAGRFRDDLYQRINDSHDYPSTDYSLVYSAVHSHHLLLCIY